MKFEIKVALKVGLIQTLHRWSIKLPLILKTIKKYSIYFFLGQLLHLTFFFISDKLHTR